MKKDKKEGKIRKRKLKKKKKKSAIRKEDPKSPKR